MSKKFRKVFKQLKTPLSWALTLILVSQMFPAQGMAYAIEEATQALVPEVEEAVVYEDELLNEDVAIVEEAPVEETAVAEDEAAAAEEEAIAPEAEDAVEPAAEPEAEVEPAVDPEPADEAEPATDAEPAVDPEAEAETEPEPEPETEPEPEGEPEPAAEIAYPEQRLTATAGNMSVVVTAPEGALPEGSQLTASLIDTAYVADAVEAAVDAKGKTAEDMVAIDVTILDADGNEIQPLLPVSVKFANAGVSGSDIAVYHIDSETGAANEVDTATATSRVQSFEADGFSVYVVVNQGEDARLTVKFMNGSTEVATMQVKKSDEGQFDTVLYDPGTGKLAEDQVFRGWTDKSSYTVADIDSGMTIAEVRDAVKAELDKEGGITDGETMTFYALTYIVYDVTYKAKESVVLGTDPVYVVNRGDEAEYTINMSYAPESSDQDFKGWFVNPVANAKIKDAQAVEGTPYPNETQATLTGSITLTVDAPLGAWLIFKENGQNVSYTSPQFLENEQVTTKPTDPTRVGYTFGGWYTDAACTDGNEFTFGQALASTTTVYAKWTPQSTANYTVIIWKQNVDDAKDAADNAKTYDFAESVTLSGPTNSVINTVTASGTGDNRYASVNGTARRYTGFHLNKFDENVTIAPEGTSVLNVYYDRNTVTLTFMEYQSSGWSGSWVEYETMTGLYGQTLSQNNYTWPTEFRWTDSTGSSGTTTTFLDAFILPSGGNAQTYYGHDHSGNNYIRFYKQDADGSYPTEATNTVRASGGTFYITDKYNGYKAVEYSTNGRTWTTLGEKDSQGRYASVSNYSSLYIHFAPLQYNILFMDGVYVDGNGNPVEGYSSRGQLKEVENINFGSSIASYAEGGADYYEPTFNGFVFSGWYVDDACTTPYTWTTMPEGVTVYAKWVQTQYRVFLHPNVPTSDTSFSMGGQNTSFRVDAGETINAINGVRDDYELVGWYKDEKCTQNFNFEAYVLNDSNTSEYDKTRSTELDLYGNPTENTNKDVDRPWITRSLDLYAKWRSKLLGAEGIGIVYDPNGGSNAPTDTLLYKDDSQAVAQGASTAPSADKKFSHWVVQKWNGTEFVDTDVTVLPGDTYTVLKSSAQVVENEGSTEENPSYTYTVQLRAEYVDAEHPTTTHIDWYANNGTDAKVSDENVTYNASVAIKPATTFTYDGHTFLGWAKKHNTDTSAPTAVNFLWYKDGKFYSDAACTTEATYIAADEKQPYDDLYAIWATDVEVEVTGSTDSKVYNGSEQTNDQYTVTYKVGGVEAELPTGITASQDVTAAKGTNVGDYEGSVTVTLSGSATGYVIKTASATDAIKLNIKPKAVTVTADDKSKAYGDADPELTATVEGLIGSDTINYTLSRAAGENVGEYTITPSGEATQGNYTVTYDPGTLTITPVAVTVTAEDKTKVYGDADPELTWTVTGLKGSDTKDVLTVVITRAAGENVGEYTITPSGEATQGNYTVTYVPGTLTITPKPVTITTGSDKKAYDGTPLTKDDATIEGLVEGETVTLKATGTITEVGTADNTYSIDWGTTNKDNYTVSEELGTLTITTNAVAVTLTAPSDSKTYDGTALTAPGTEAKPVTASGLPEGFTVEATATGSQTDAGNSKNVVNDGYVIKNAAGEDKTANFTNVTKADGTLTVNPKAVTITTGSDSKAYDGTALTKDEATIDGLVEGESVTLKATGSQTEVGSSDNTYEITWDKAKATNYTVTDNLGTLTVTSTDAQVVLTAASGSKTYDGTALTDATVTATGLPEGFTAQATATGTQTDAGSSANVVNDGYKFFDKDGNDKTANFTNVKKVDGTLTVNPAPVTITTGSDSKAYDGTPLTKDEATITGLVNNETATVKANGTITEVGTADNTYSITWDTAKASNYTVTENLGELEITTNSSEVTLTAPSDTKTYDGKALTAPGTAEKPVTASGLPEGFTVEATASGSQTDAGNSKNVVNDGYVIKNADGVDKTANFTNVKKTDGTLTVEPKAVTITTGSDKKAYDGTPLTKDEATIEGLVEGETVTLKATGTITEVGTTPNTYSITWDKAKADNYTVTEKLGTLEITTNAAEVTLTAPSDSKTYDGTALTAPGTEAKPVTATGLPEGFTVEATASGTITNVGKVANVVNDGFKILDADGNDKTANFTSVAKINGTLEITPRTVTLTSESDSKVYDGTALTKPEVTVGGDGFVAGEVSDIKATGTITEVGTVDNTITYTEGAAFKADNYSITKDEGTLEITVVTDKVTVTITEHKGSETYDGTEKTVTGYDVTSISNELYKEADFTFSGNDTVKGTDAGTYDMELKSADFTNTNENFSNVEFVIIDGTLEIAKRKVTLTSATDEKEYDGNPLTNDEVTVSGDGFVDGEGATYDVTGTQTLVGSSENTFTYTLNEGTKAANYDITTVPGTLTVTNRDAKYEITVEANSTEATYDGKEHAATGVKTLEFEVEGNKYTVSGLTTSDPKSTDACEMPNNITGTAVVKDAAGNDVTEQFAVKTVNGKLVINPLEVTIKSGDAEKQYDGKALTSDEITYPKPFVEGEGVIITMTGSQTLVGQSDNTFTYVLRDNTKAANYTITTEFGTLKVTDRTNPFEVTVVSKSDEVTYDGNEHKVEGFETLEFTIDGVKFTVSGLTAEGKGTDAGEYPDTISGTAVVKDADGNDVTAQFKVNQTEGKLVIKPVTDKVTVTITEHSGEFVFDNTEKTVEGYDVTSISNPLYKDTDFAFSGDATVKGTNAGTYDMELKPADFSNTSKNFTDVEFVIVDGQLVITPKHIDDPDDPGNPSKDLTVTGPEDTVYNGLEQKQPVQVTDKETGQVLVEGTDFELTYGDDMVNVGEVPVTVKGIGNYEGTFNLSYKITPAPLKITTGSAEKVYDATPLTSDECEVEGLVNGETLRVDPDGSQTLVGSSDNTVTITWADDVIDHYPLLGARILSTVENPTAKKSNYEVEVTLGTLTVTDDGVPTDLVVKKTHEGTEFGLGETITFTLKATNIYDEERDITFVEIEGVEVAQATFEKVAPGETVETTATYTVTEADILAGEFKNQVTVKIGDAEHGPAEDIVVIEEKNPHLTVTKTVTSAAETYAVGETIEYKIVVENDGNLTISDIKVTDALTGDEWTIEQLAPGEKQEFAAKYTVTEADATAGKVVNTATATGKDPEGNDPSVTPGTTETPVKKPELPKTGDASGLVSAAASASMGLMSLAGWLHTLRRRKEDDEQ